MSIMSVLINIFLIFYLKQILIAFYSIENKVINVIWTKKVLKKNF
jgi:hypothetical protein